MKQPSTGQILANRVRSNNDWLAQCHNLHRDEQKRIACDARDARKAKKLSLRAVARSMGVSAMFLCDLERGNRNWTTHTMNLWAEAIDNL